MKSQSKQRKSCTSLAKLVVNMCWIASLNFFTCSKETVLYFRICLVLNAIERNDLMYV